MAALRAANKLVAAAFAAAGSGGFSSQSLGFGGGGAAFATAAEKHRQSFRSSCGALYLVAEEK